MTDYKPHPLRIQRRRTKGFRLPPGACSVTRPGKWENPFGTAEEFDAVFQAIEQSRMEPHEFKSDTWRKVALMLQSIRELRGFKLACFCGLDKPCHADTLAREANK